MGCSHFSEDSCCILHRPHSAHTDSVGKLVRVVKLRGTKLTVVKLFRVVKVRGTKLTEVKLFRMVKLRGTKLTEVKLFRVVKLRGDEDDSGENVQSGEASEGRS